MPPYDQHKDFATIIGSAPQITSWRRHSVQAALFSPLMERASPYAPVVVPDRIDVRARNTSAPSLFTPVATERKDLFAPPVYPDRVVRPAPQTTSPFFALFPKPEVRSPYSPPVYQDQLRRAVLHPSNVPYTIPPIDVVPSLPPFVEIRLVFVPIRRSAQPYSKEYFDVPEVEQPQQFNALAVSALAQVNRRTYATAEHLVSPLLSQSVQKAFGVVLPASIRRLPKTHPPAWSSGPQPLERSATFAPVVFPDYALGDFRAVYSTLRQQPQAVVVLDPKPERTRTYSVTVYPDTPVFGFWSQKTARYQQPQAIEVFDLKPNTETIPAIVADDMVRGEYVRPYNVLRQQPQALEVLDPKPERTRTYSAPVYPNTPVAPFWALNKAVRSHITNATMVMRPELATAYVPPSTPAVLTRVSVPVSEQTVLAPRGSATQKTFGVVTVAAVRRVPCVQPPALVSMPPAVERPSPYTFTGSTYPDTARRALYPVSEQPAVTSVPPKADRPRPYAEFVGPVWLARVTYKPSAQLHVTSVGPRPEVPVPHTGVVAPSTVLRPSYPTQIQPTYTANVKPIKGPVVPTRYLRLQAVALTPSRWETVILPGMYLPGKLV